ncbi:baseplate wedge subunit [Klebsiella phage KMI9]|uniref:Baseplate wedge subunit n=10 Tax=root TaxID=1 RepID=A0A6H0X2D6_9CAUD|nr:baseplate wedge subunit [Klebsiella phage KP27]YP_009194442.1 baseplate wedge subunit [Klebsiella phage Matisse]YP_009607391.1 baseplate wedge subunit [Klebsiella phage Miro]YP_009626430.1 baseplate wedge subunit [Klebsiella phage PMBT1]YP_010089109.1 baseplate wedge subunit [Escherichia phage phT4A]MBG2194952.1 baseplate wedge protein 53 [Klebsiella pneumoniae]QEG10671.1 baseplate wedge subunit [Klebsiella phage KMI9]QIW86291.1 baseplate wedge subunit [Klebsiella phage P-KP2]QQO91598.1 
MLFSYFPPVDYKGTQTTDIFRDYRFYFNRVIGKYKTRSYQITGTLRPEQLAESLYGNQQYYWILLMLNSVYDPFYGWISDQEAAYQCAIQRYSEVGGEQVLYHVDENNNKYYNLVEDPNNPGHWYDKGDKPMLYLQYQGVLAPVDIYEDAVLQNEAKRTIKIISPSDIQAFLNDFIKEMEKANS